MELLKFVFARDYIFRFIIAFYLFSHCYVYQCLQSTQTRIHFRPYFLCVEVQIVYESQCRLVLVA